MQHCLYWERLAGDHTSHLEGHLAVEAELAGNNYEKSVTFPLLCPLRGRTVIL